MRHQIIMCVDDERQVLDSLVRDLSKVYIHHEIETCESAEEALELRDELFNEGKNISVYIVDQRMPGMKGIEFLNKIEKNTGKILLTAYADTQVAIDGINDKCIDFYMVKPYGEELFSNIDYLLFSQSKGTYVALARTDEEREEALKIQNTVFSEDHLNLPYEEGVKIIGEDKYVDDTEIYVAIRDRGIIGTTSLSKSSEGLAEKFGTNFGLPIEELYDLSSLKGLDDRLAQVRNATVLPEYQNQRIVPMIWGEIYRQLVLPKDRSDYIVILAASEIREKERVLAVSSYLEKNGLNSSFKVSLKESDKSNQTINDNSIVIPRLLKMYLKMNFRVIGEPVFYNSYQMFDYPMILKLDEIAEPYKTWFLGRKL